MAAKLDSNDKVLSIKSSDTKKLSQDEVDKIINYYNKKGVLKIRIDMKKMELFIETNLKILSKSNSKLESSIKQMIQMGTVIGLSMASNYGFIMVNDEDKKKSIDGFDNIEHFEELNYSETFANTDVVTNTAVVSQAKPSIGQAVSQAKEEQSMIVIIPKILLTSDRREFIDYISKIFSTNQESKILYEILKDVLDKVIAGSNPEVKIANLIGVIMRYVIVFAIVSEAQKLGANVFSQDDMIKFVSRIFLDFVNNIPSDRCLFNDNSDFFEFSPNVCNIKPIKQESCQKCEIPESNNFKLKDPEYVSQNSKTLELKCPECKKTDCICPECKTEDTKSKNFIIVVLAIIIVIVALLYFTKECPKDLKNLAKLNG